MANFDTSTIRPVQWLGDSRANVQNFPKDVQKKMGDELQSFQFGRVPRKAKPFKGVGSGVFEIAIRHDTDAYRSVLAVKLGETIYVLHAFQKKSKQGIATSKQDVDLIKRRYNRARELAKNEH